MAKSRHPARRRRATRAAGRSRRLTPPRHDDEIAARPIDLTRARQKAQDLSRCPRQHAARSVGNRLSVAVLDCERMKRARHVHDRCVTEKARDGLHVERRRHHDDAQIVPGEQRLTGQRKPEVGVNASLVELVEDDRREIRKQRILLKPRGQDPFGDDEQTRIARRSAFRIGCASRLRGRASTRAPRRSLRATARAATRRGCSRMTGPASTRAGGMRVVLPAPGEADSTTARRRARASRTSATCASIISGTSGLNGLNGGEAPRVEQGLDVRIMAAESPVCFGAIDRVAVRQDMRAQSIVGARHPTRRRPRRTPARHRPP